MICSILPNVLLLAAAMPSPEALAVRGMTAAPATVQLMVRQIKARPDDIVTRTKLIGYYYAKQTASPKYKLLYEQQVMWTIAHHPDAPICGTNFALLEAGANGTTWAKQTAAWTAALKQKPNSALVAANASQFFEQFDLRRAARVLQTAVQKEPRNASYHDRLGMLHLLQVQVEGGSDAADAAVATRELRLAQTWTTDPYDRYMRWERIGFSALAAGDLAMAKHAATELQNPPESVSRSMANVESHHKSNIILGRVALQQKHLHQAETCLAAAAKMPAGTQISSFGPNMSLANDLLTAGDTAPVLRYLTACSRLWKSPKLNQWTAAIKQGKRPDFGPNLWY